MKNILVEALSSAGDIILKNFQAVRKVSEKESISSIVTEVDLESERRIIAIIEEKYPHHNILSEECGFKNKTSAYTWIIDPLDGTSNYAAGLPWFGVLIALMKGDVPVLAGAYLPVTQRMYLAEAGKGAYVNDNRLTIGNLEINKALVAFSMDYTRDEPYLQKGLDFYRFLVQHARNVRSTNCLLDALYVAEGRFGGCINMFCSIWDIVSPYLIITEAGGAFKSLDFSEIAFLVNEKSIRKNYPVVAGSHLFVDTVSRGVSQHSDSQV